MSELSYIPIAAQSTDVVITNLKYAFLAGLVAFIVLIPFCRSNKSFFDPIAARKVLRKLRLFVFLQICCLGVLFYFYFNHGSPLRLHSQLSYGNGDSYVYGYGRPGAGLVFIGFGLFADTHPVVRIACMIGCGVQIMADSLSAYQIHDYRDQQLKLSAPSNGYSPNMLLTYFYRDIVSVALSTVILLLTAHLTNIVGWCDPQIIHPSLISGRDYDRYSAMRRSRGDRMVMERLGIIDGPDSSV
jgi:hypothetical protein